MENYKRTASQGFKPITPSIGIRQSIIILFALILMFTCGCVSSRNTGTGVERVQAQYKKYLQTHPDAGEKEIYDALKNKQYDEAIKQCKKLRKLRPDDNDVYLLEGLAYYNKKDYLSSIDRFSQVIVFDKNRGMLIITGHSAIYGQEKIKMQ